MKKPMSMPATTIPVLLLFCLATLFPLPGFATNKVVRVAVASNFTRPMQALAEQFHASTGHQAQLSFGSSGKFVAQIRHGAPFEVFLSADQDKPQQLIKLKLADADSVFTYARGKLALWSSQTNYVDNEGKILKQGDFRHLALATPKLAPYGLAAIQTLEHQQLFEQLQPRFVMGENISQAYQFIKTGNAALGFVALSQITENGRLREGSAWIIPGNYYDPINQDAILLNKGLNNIAAQALMTFLQSPSVQKRIQDFGYAAPADSDIKPDMETHKTLHESIDNKTIPFSGGQ